MAEPALRSPFARAKLNGLKQVPSLSKVSTNSKKTLYHWGGEDKIPSLVYVLKHANIELISSSGRHLGVVTGIYQHSISLVLFIDIED